MGLLVWRAALAFVWWALGWPLAAAGRDEERCNGTVGVPRFAPRASTGASAQGVDVEGSCKTQVLIQKAPPVAHRSIASARLEEEDFGGHAPTASEGASVAGAFAAAHWPRPGPARQPRVAGPVAALQRPKFKGLHRPRGHPQNAEQSTDTSICFKDLFAHPELCPEVCPFAAQMEGEFCHFRCVTGEKCGLMGTMRNNTIPDIDLHICRQCAVQACKICVPSQPGISSEALERCQVCLPGYELTSDGQCRMQCLQIFVAIGFVGGFLALLGLVWYGLHFCHPAVNREGVEFGLKCRERAALREAETGQLYPLTTNLLEKNVAGAGTMCLFRFQLGLVIWACGLLALWLGIVLLVSSDLLILGDREASSPQLLCAVVAWGHKRQYELLWTKVLWCFLAYLFSFIGALFYARQQTRLFAHVDTHTVEMSDFVALLTGLPEFNGDEQPEAEIKQAVEQATGQKIVGISVAWNTETSADKIDEAVEGELFAEDPLVGPSSVLRHPSNLARMNAKVLGWDIDHAGPDTPRKDRDLDALLRGMRSTDKAFVVFDSEAGQNEALGILDESISIRGIVCALEECLHQPREVLWENFSVSDDQRCSLLLTGIGQVFVGCIIWTLLLYMPYAHYVASFTYMHGDEPGIFSDGLFCALVVGAQLGLFMLSDSAARATRFLYEDKMQAMYTGLYNGALILNLVMDIILQGYLSYVRMIGSVAHTHDGRLLGDLESFHEVLLSYRMQKSFGNLLFAYCWPATFLVPFLFEPLIAQWFPKHLGTLLVQSDPRMTGLKAAKALQLGEMEQGRYADILFNAILVACIPFIAPAYLHLILVAFIFSHIYIYCYDQVKVLRCVVSFHCSTPDIHNLGEKLFAIPVSLLLGALVFKGNQMTGTGDLASGILRGHIWVATGGAMLVHLVVHIAALEWIHTQCRGTVDRSRSMRTYCDATRFEKATYFSCNPVHCLRSSHGLLGGEPPVSFYSPLRDNG